LLSLTTLRGCQRHCRYSSSALLSLPPLTTAAMASLSSYPLMTLRGHQHRCLDRSLALLLPLFVGIIVATVDNCTNGVIVIVSINNVARLSALSPLPFVDVVVTTIDSRSVGVIIVTDDIAQLSALLSPQFVSIFVVPPVDNRSNGVLVFVSVDDVTRSLVSSLPPFVDVVIATIC
jgi:hypothetical protein